MQGRSGRDADARRAAPDAAARQLTPREAAEAIDRLDALTRTLRVACPWDREQDARSIVPHTVEEAYELAQAAYDDDDAKLLDELGDVLFQVHFLALLLEERGAGSLAEVAENVRRKLIRRHPHVFPEPESEPGDGSGESAPLLGEGGAEDVLSGEGAPLVEVRGAGDVLRNWDAIKSTEAGREPGIFGEVPENLPGPLLARKVQRRAASTGFDYEDVPYDGLREELAELEAAESPADRFHEVGDVLFAAVNVARKLKVDPELALRAAARRFSGRVESAADRAARDGAGWNDLAPESQLGYYDEARLAEDP